MRRVVSSDSVWLRSPAPTTRVFISRTQLDPVCKALWRNDTRICLISEWYFPEVFTGQLIKQCYIFKRKCDTRVDALRITGVNCRRTHHQQWPVNVLLKIRLSCFRNAVPLSRYPCHWPMAGLTTIMLTCSQQPPNTAKSRLKRLGRQREKYTVKNTSNTFQASIGKKAARNLRFNYEFNQPSITFEGHPSKLRMD